MDLEDALRDARRTAAEIAAANAEPQRLVQEQRRREDQLVAQALEHLRPLGGDRFVVVYRDAFCEDSPFRDNDRFRSPDGELWRVVEDYPCWVMSDDPGDLDHLWLLLDDGLIGRCTSPAHTLTRLDPRQGVSRGREFVSTLPLAPGFVTTVDEQILAWTIVRYEQAR